MVDWAEGVKILEEVVQRLESLEAAPIGAVDFHDARVDGYVTTALTAARAALTIATNRGEPEENARR